MLKTLSAHAEQMPPKHEVKHTTQTTGLMGKLADAANNGKGVEKTVETPAKTADIVVEKAVQAAQER